LRARPSSQRGLSWWSRIWQWAFGLLRNLVFGT
jgi:hypothetical protein